MKSGSSAETLGVLNAIIDEIDEICEAAGYNPSGKKSLQPLKIQCPTATRWRKSLTHF